MAGTTAARKATTPRRPRRTKAQIAADNAGKAAALAAEANTRTVIAPGVVHESVDLPEIPGGAIDFGAPAAEGATAYQRPREVLFRWNGVGYTVPAKFTLLDSMNYVRTASMHGVEVAMVEAMERALGTVAFGVLLGLADVAEVGEAQVQRLVDTVIGRIIGTEEAPKG
jgi:hypothetical protein